MKSIVFILFIAIHSRAADSMQSGPIKIDLPHAVEYGIHNATIVLKATNNKEVTGSDLLAAYGRFLPNLALDADYGWAQGKAYAPTGVGLFDANYRQADYSISSTLNIFDGFGDISALRSNTLRNQAADYSLKRARQQIAIDVTSAFLQALLDQHLVEISEHNLSISQERLRLIEASRKVGSANVADLYRQQAELSRDETALINAKNRSKFSKLRLLQKLRLDARKEYAIVEPDLKENTTPAQLGTEASLVDQALGDRVDLKAGNNLAGAARADVGFAQKDYFPILNLTAAYGGSGRIYQSAFADGASVLPMSQDSMTSQLGSQTHTSVMLTLDWQIFSRFTTTQNVVHAEANSSNAQIDYDDLSNEVIVEVRQGYSDFNAANDQVRTATAGLEAAQKAFDFINGRYKLGASTFLDLTTAQADLVQAQVLYIQAIINLKLRAEALLFFVGRDPAS